jgi:hypothetical protein
LNDASDASDVAIATTFGPNTLGSLKVWYDDQRTRPPVLPRDSTTDLGAAGSAG